MGQASHDDVTDWLLDPSQPAVRYRALLDLLDKPKASKDVEKARREIPKRGWAAEILSKQAADGTWEWEARKSLYVPKYISTTWNLIVLADLGMTANNQGVRRACELFLMTTRGPMVVSTSPAAAGNGASCALPGIWRGR